jgi:hypothetical protein
MWNEFIGNGNGGHTMTGRICLTPQELRCLTGYALPGDQASCLDNLGVSYVPRGNGTLGVLRNSIERRRAPAELRLPRNGELFIEITFRGQLSYYNQ